MGQNPQSPALLLLLTVSHHNMEPLESLTFFDSVIICPEFKILPFAIKDGLIQDF